MDDLIKELAATKMQLTHYRVLVAGLKTILVVSQSMGNGGLAYKAAATDTIIEMIADFEADLKAVKKA